jgi:hypothetical protein
MAMRMLAENWELLADRIPIGPFTGDLVHILICFAKRRALL